MQVDYDFTSNVVSRNLQSDVNEVSTIMDKLSFDALRLLSSPKDIATPLITESVTPYLTSAELANVTDFFRRAASQSLRARKREASDALILGMVMFSYVV